MVGELIDQHPLLTLAELTAALVVIGAVVVVLVLAAAAVNASRHLRAERRASVGADYGPDFEAGLDRLRQAIRDEQRRGEK